MWRPSRPTRSVAERTTIPRPRPMHRDVFVDEGLARGQTESPKPSPKNDACAVCVRWVRCGYARCRCMNGGPQHGPYYARYWWVGGIRRKAYVRKGDATEAVAACADRRRADRQARTD